MSIYLQRHGESETNVEKVFTCRRLDPHLTELGRSQVQEKVATYARKGIQRIVSSPATRAMETADILASGLSCSVEVDDDLLEVDLGALEGKSERAPEHLEYFVSTIDRFLSTEEAQFLGGESSHDVFSRIERVEKKYFELEGTILVGHATLFAVILGRMLEYDNVMDLFLPRAGTASLSWVTNGEYPLSSGTIAIPAFL